jgi:cytochrome P450
MLGAQRQRQSEILLAESAAGESTASLLGSAAWILVSHHDIQEQVRAHPERLGAFIEETLRYESPFRGHYRHVVKDTTLAGVDVPADRACS